VSRNCDDSVIARVRVPASSANLGPGYDAFGLALALYDVFEAEPAGEWVLEVRGEGAGELRTDAENEVSRAMRRVFSDVGHTGAARIICENAIPVGRGLGSSAAAIVGGLVLGNELAGAGLAHDRLFELATELEGHPDNVAAALFGGFTLCWNDDARPHAARIEPAGGLAAVALVSDSALPTAESRRALPVTVAHSDAAYTAGRAGLLAAGIALGRADLVRAGASDRIHEPYREALVPDIAIVRAALLAAGADAAVLSGAGPTVIALVTADDDAAALERARALCDSLPAFPGRREPLALMVERTGAAPL